MRIAWFHPPKTGTSLGTALVHYANASLPPDVAMSRCAVDPAAPSSLDESLLRPAGWHRCIGPTDHFADRFPHDVWFRGIFALDDKGDMGAHRAVKQRSSG